MKQEDLETKVKDLKETRRNWKQTDGSGRHRVDQQLMNAYGYYLEHWQEDR